MASGGPTGTSFQIVSTDADIFDDEAPTNATEEKADVESATQEACAHKRNMDGLFNDIILFPSCFRLVLVVVVWLING